MPRFELRKEVVALVIDEDEGGEVNDIDFPDGFHAEFRIFDARDGLDVVGRENRRRSADGAEVETTVFAASVGDDLCAVALGNHDERSAVVLELVHVRVHAVCGGRSHGTAREAIGRLGRSGIEDRMVLKIGRHGLSGIE